MTIERPMFPPRADAQIIQFSSFAASRPAKEAVPDTSTGYRHERLAKRRARLAEMAESPERFTESCRNSYLRSSRRDVWRQATRLTNYWRARLDWQSALAIAQIHSIADANSFPKSDDGDDRFALINLWRAALVKQMLTPAPDVGAVNWKRAQLRSRQHEFTDVKSERIERAIAADIEWLAAHPTRKSIAATRQAHKGE